MTKTNYLHRVLTGTCCIALMTAAPAFAGRRLSDKEMDKATAKGQPTVFKGNGKQTIYDNAEHTVNGGGYSQADAKAVSLANVAGENNVAVGQNLGLSTGTLRQENKIRQNLNAEIKLAAPKHTYGKPPRDGGKPHGGKDEPRNGGDKPKLEAMVPTNGEQKPDIKDDQNGRPNDKRHYVRSGDRIRGDHVKLGDGDQHIDDKTKFSVILSGNAQQGAVGVSLLNVAGRNNVAVGQNIGAGFGSDRDGLRMNSGGGGTLTQTNTIIQSH